jgi:Family of unknown function (DUF6535)
VSRFGSLLVPALMPYTHLRPDHPDIDDPSSKMWSLCNSQANEHDTALAKRWKDAMDGILIYVSMQRPSSMALGYLNKTLLRRVFSPRRLPHSSSKASSYFDLIPARIPHNFFGKLHNNLLQSPMAYPSPPLRRQMTRFGPHVMPSM